MCAKLAISHRGKKRTKVFKNTLLRRTFGPKTVETVSSWPDEEFHDLYSSPDITRIIKSRRMR
jgi:hypothetical protein